MWQIMSETSLNLSSRDEFSQVFYFLHSTKPNWLQTGRAHVQSISAAGDSRDLSSEF